MTLLFQIPSQFVESMLEVHTKYTELISGVFSADQQFVGALDKACASAINYRPNPKTTCKSPELVSGTISCSLNNKICYLK